MRNANAVTYLRVLGAGEGGARDVDGSVARAGFAVGAELPDSDGVITSNSFANAGGPDGRTYFLGAFMSESLGSSVFSSAGLQGVGGVTPNPQSAVPIIRGVVMAPSGVILRLSASFDTTNTSDAPASSYVADDATAQGNIVGDVRLEEGGLAKQEFVMILNGHIGADVNYSNVITASFDPTAGNYFANIFNKDPYKIQDAGHFLYANWDIHPSTAAVTGTVLVGSAYGADLQNGLEPSAFLTTSSLTYNSGSTEVPNYEGFEDRFGHARSPWVISQRFGGSPANLFKLHAIDAGAGVSNLYKISIENITPSPDATNKFGSFDIIVRDWRDRDGALQPLEKFRGVNLDPRSDRYIAKVIGDAHVFFDFDRDIGAQAVVVEGNYPARSNYIRVEVDSGVETGTVDPTALPLGFRGIAHLVTSGSMPLASNDCDSTLSSADLVKRAVTPPLPMRSNITRGSGGRVQASPSFFWGTQFEHVVTLTDTNSSTLKNDSLNSFVKYFPDYSTQYANFVAGDNTGAVDTAALGIIDADRFCNNLFTLENVQVVTGSNTLADVNKWANATYVRRGNIVADAAAKTRALKVDDLTLRVNRRLAKFTFPLQGGFDGVNLFNRETAELTNNAVTADMDNTARGLQDGATVKAYTKALEIMKNTVNTDIQLLAIPGIRHESVTDRAADAVRDRFDALYIMDVRQYDDNVTEVTSSAQTPSVTYTAQEFSSRTLDNSFAAAYFPDVVLQDPTTRESLVVPPSVAVLGALALNDRVGYPWFAPAGTTRGALPTVTRANVPLSKLNMDTLYDVNINPLVALQPDSGVVVWGQKTLQAAASALDRVNVRRLLIEIRRQVRDIAQTILFEPNRAATLARFTAAVTPRLQRIQALAGLDRFKVIIDSSTTTQADVENNTVRGKIFVQPTRSIEFVSLDFVVTNNIAE
jgi:phage tail sheath protein FI